MESSLFQNVYNPDVLSCIANLSNDEVFTPPELANKILDMLPQELFENPDTTFLDPCCKSGVFLREIAKRLIKGLEYQIPDLEKRVEHIFSKQLFGIAITELTSLLSRRSVYCSKYPSSEFSAYQFSEDKPQGNIIYQRIKHTWKDGRCIYCGASQSEYDRNSELEAYAYQFIHNLDVKKVFNMKFDVIIGNPPYQLAVNEAGKGLGAIPLYNKFVEQSKKLNPQYLCMIIPSRWFSGGVGLDEFRKNMLSDNRISHIFDYIDSNDCFPGVDINGGICYFLWDRNYKGLCNYTNIANGKTSFALRNLSEHNIFIRRNEAVSIVHKVLSKKEIMLSETGGCSPQTPYGFLSTFQGTSEPINSDDCKILSSKGWMYVARNKVTKYRDSIDQYKAMFSKLSCEHAGNPDKSGMYRVLSRMELLNPGEICTQSYLIACPSDNKSMAENTYSYLSFASDFTTL